MRNLAHFYGRIGTIDHRVHNERNYVTLSVAVDDSYTKEDEKIEVTHWLTVQVTRDKAANYINQNAQVGDEIYIVAKIKQRSFEKDGSTQKVIEFEIGAPGTSYTLPKGRTVN